MYITSIEYTDFRNIAHAVIEPDRGINVLYGNNAQGKTNALEGIYLFAFGRSFRGAKEKEMITFGREISALKLKFADKRRENCLEIRADHSGRRIFIKNGVIIRRLSEFIGCFQAVLFCPEHLSIIKAGPGERRMFVDTALMQLYPDYIRTLQDYNHILRSRNTVIKEYHTNPKQFDDTIDIWSQQLSVAAEKISRERSGYVDRLSGEVKQIFSDMTGGREDVVLNMSEPKTADEYKKLLDGNHQREISAGFTLYGPHREDMTITLNGRSARDYASQGQQRSVALALKLAEGKVNSDVKGEYPVFLFDDVLSELDEGRRHYLLGGLDGRQVVMTGCEKTAEAVKSFYVENGKII